MEESLNSSERRRYPRLLIHLPLEYQDTGDSCSRGAMVVDAGEGGFLIESTRDMPVGTKLSLLLLFPNGFELADFKAVAQVVRKEPYLRKNSEGYPSWEGYRYGLEFIQVLEEDRWKLNLILGKRSEFETFLSLFSQP
ncbi:MAG TPA: PilZ domain-containing protein [Thermodesulfobacteriota bacterium]|nr:PilZ domain-containing protein [Thermodesulfobacteriota bacterium]